MGTFQFVSELIMTLLFLAAAIWGAVISFGKRSALFLQIVACGLGCMALGNVFSFVLQLTAPEEILRELKSERPKMKSYLPSVWQRAPL